MVILSQSCFMRFYSCQFIDEMFIIDFEGYDNTPEIEIYNDYRE